MSAAASEARKLLTEKQALRAMRVSNLAIEQLHQIAEGKRPRGAGFQIAAIRLMADHTLPKPAQEHELSGSVTIQVVSPLMGAPGSGRQAKVAMSADLEPQALSLQQGPITTNMSTEIGDSGAVIDSAITAEVVIEAGRLGPPEPRLTVEERRAAARDDWQREQAALRGDGDV